MIRILTVSTRTEQGLPPLNRSFIHLDVEVEEVSVIQLESTPFPGLTYYEHVVERISTNPHGEVISQFQNIGMSMTPLAPEELLALEVLFVNKPRLLERTVNA